MKVIGFLVGLSILVGLSCSNSNISTESVYVSSIDSINKITIGDLFRQVSSIADKISTEIYDSTSFRIGKYNFISSDVDAAHNNDYDSVFCYYSKQELMKIVQIAPRIETHYFILHTDSIEFIIPKVFFNDLASSGQKIKRPDPVFGFFFKKNLDSVFYFIGYAEKINTVTQGVSTIMKTDSYLLPIKQIILQRDGYPNDVKYITDINYTKGHFSNETLLMPKLNSLESIDQQTAICDALDIFNGAVESDRIVLPNINMNYAEFTPLWEWSGRVNYTQK